MKNSIFMLLVIWLVLPIFVEAASPVLSGGYLQSDESKHVHFEVKHEDYVISVTDEDVIATLLASDSACLEGLRGHPKISKAYVLDSAISKLEISKVFEVIRGTAFTPYSVFLRKIRVTLKEGGPLVFECAFTPSVWDSFKGFDRDPMADALSGLEN